MKSFGLTDKGAVRKDNQDSFIIENCDAEGCVIVSLCDGMGGEKAGGLASSISNKAFVSYIRTMLNTKRRKRTDYSQLLRDACNEANGIAYEYSKFSEEYNGMGTTMVGGVIKNNGNGYIINVGDSRAYLISLKNNGIRQITTDHSLVQELVDAGIITKEQARYHPNRNVITRAVGSEKNVRSDFFEFTLDSKSVLILCSDGLTDTLEESEILFTAKNDPDPEKLCRALMDKALSRGAADNVTIVAVAG